MCQTNRLYYKVSVAYMSYTELIVAHYNTYIDYKHYKYEQ